MDSAPQPTEDTESLAGTLDELLDRARHFILDLIVFIDARLAQLGNAPMSARLVRLLTRRALLPAEAALRRAIILIAATLPAPGPSKTSTKPPSSSHSRQPAAPARAPVFCMSEPQPRAGLRPAARNLPETLPEHLLPRLTLLTEAALCTRSPAPAPAPRPSDPAASFHRRLTALCIAFQDPFREARRWRRHQAARRPGARPPLAPKIPGARKSLGETRLNLLRELTTSAEAALAHTNTS